jgi:hypothetical protein
LIDRVGWSYCGRCFEPGIPFEVAQRATLFGFFETGGVQRDLHDLLADRVDEVQRNAAAVVIDAVTAKQMLVGHGFDSLRVSSRCATREC